jgi:SAM-dependent methyltransferase
MKLSERHVREWLAAMTAAGYLVHDGQDSFALPDEHASVLTSARAALAPLLVSFAQPYERLVQTFRSGGGLSRSAYPEATHTASDRLSAGWYDDELVQRWLPATGVDALLVRGASVCDVGCGGGVALVTLARAYPRATFIGYDLFGPNIHRARERARSAGVSDRVEFHQLDAGAGLPRSFDLITTFDVLHEAVEPLHLLRAIRAALHAGGTYLCLTPAADAHPSLLYGISVLFSLSTSLAHGGVGLGSCGLSEARLQELSRRAGFASMTRIPTDDSCNELYALV